MNRTREYYGGAKKKTNRTKKYRKRAQSEMPQQTSRNKKDAKGPDRWEKTERTKCSLPAHTRRGTKGRTK